MTTTRAKAETALTTARDLLTDVLRIVNKLKGHAHNTGDAARRDQMTKLWRRVKAWLDSNSTEKTDGRQENAGAARRT